MTIYRLERADRDEFALNQVIYSAADIEMWYDWKARLDDTKFTEECYWLMQEDKRFGGIIQLGDTLMYPFLIPPAADRKVFWTALISSLGIEVRQINGVLQKDVDILLCLGFEAQTIRQVMCSPTGCQDAPELAQGLTLYELNDSTDLNPIKNLMRRAYEGGIDYESFGTPSEDELLENIRYVLDVYRHRNLSIHVTEDLSEEAIGVCLAGVGEQMPLGFAEIAEIGVAPSHQGLGIAEFMLRYVKKQAGSCSDVVKLCVTVGNPAANLYQKMGFQGAPSFTNMSRTAMK
ncbi:GNAT family N-acetyltransferase [Saccharibacillus deserti]|uniref:GNAT family N-acetyltransferase n=1 Tax=Saccharibacillus deserti TaxID=1634444 RepID=UPI001555D8C4|nr:GNAT family N-acetyltransferase [Saccharibacillus deserti]